MDLYNNEGAELLIKAILSLKTEDEVKAYFNDILTIQELKSLSQRMEVAKMLLNNEQYSEIEKKTGASTATISRVNRCCRYGSDGYTLVFNKINKDK